jgi:hypothetical protein
MYFATIHFYHSVYHVKIQIIRKMEDSTGRVGDALDF